MKRRLWVSAIVVMAVMCALLYRTGRGPVPVAQAARAARAMEDSGSLVRGITISCRGWGRAWDSPAMGAALDDIHKLGANWMSFHPYGWIREDGSVEHRGVLDDPTVIHPIQAAHARGMKVMLIPHIGYWGSRFKWRGAITFSKDEQWRRFFHDYKDFIVTQARMAEQAGADLFCIGLEYKRTLHREADWRAVIAAVRAVYSGKLTYGANWDTYDRVPFWDALDVIGVQAYFPLTEAPNPSTQQLTAAWNRVLDHLKAFATRQDKPMIFTELGYNRAAHAAARPWDHHQGGRDADAIKLRCMEAALRRVKREPWLSGVFLWKWFPTDRAISRDYALQYDAMRRVIHQVWGEDKAAGR